jgi:hypothetical protein
MDNLKVLVVAYQRVLPLQIMIDCFLVQTDPKWEMHIIHDGSAPQEVRDIIPDDPRITFYETERRLKNYGHPNRRYLLNNVECNTDDFILITNDDNYYVPEYVRYMRQSATLGVGIVYNDCLHNYYLYDVLKSKMQTNYIDMGSFIVRADVAKAVGFTSDEFHADGIYAEACAAYCKAHKLTIKYIPKSLFIHN